MENPGDREVAGVFCFQKRKRAVQPTPGATV
ncbi:hypothetical protein ACMZ4W_01486 [Brevundimonas naejangsanensis]